MARGPRRLEPGGKAGTRKELRASQTSPGVGVGRGLVPGICAPVIVPHPGLDPDSGRQLLLQPLPEHAPVARFGHVGEDRVLLDRLHGVEVRLPTRA